MSSRHQPIAGADSAAALREYDACSCSHRRDQHTVTSVGAMCLQCADCWGFVEAGQCAACSLPAVTDGYCAGHNRLGEYRVTDEKNWAAND